MKPLPFRLALTLPWVLQALLLVGLVGSLSYRNGRQAVVGLAEELMAQIGQEVHQELDHYLQSAHRATQGHLAALESGALTLADLDTLHRYLHLQHRQAPDLTALVLGRADGELRVSYRVRPEDFGENTSLRREELPYELVVATAANPAVDQVYSAQPSGELGRFLGAFDNRDVRDRPWYRQAAATRQPGWSEPFQIASLDLLAINAYRPILEAENRLLGVLAVIVSLNQLSDFLRELTVGKTGEVFILELEGLLVANSTAAPSYFVRREPVSGERSFVRQSAAEIEAPLIQAAYRSLRARFPDLAAVDAPQWWLFSEQGRRQFVRVSPYRGDHGLQWLIVTVIPEADFTGPLTAKLWRTLGLSLGALLVAIALGVWLAERWTRSLRALTTAAQQIAFAQRPGGKGQWSSSPLPRSRIAEVALLTAAFEQMSSALQATERLRTHYAQELEQQVAAQTLALRTSEARLTAAQDLARVGLWELDLSTGAVVWSESLYRIFEADPRPIPRPDLTLLRIHPEDQERVDQQIARLFPPGHNPLAAGQPFDLDCRIFTQRGRVRYVQAQGRPIVNEQGGIVRLLGVVADITERKQAELEIARSRDLLAAIFQGSADAIFLVKAETLRIEACNQPAVALFDCEEEAELLGIGGWTLHRQPLTPEEVAALRLALEAAGSYQQDVEYQTRRGRRFWGNLTVRPIQVADRRLYLARVTDISDRKQAEADLQAAKNAAEAADRAKSAFIANMHHELRSPLNAILGFAALLQQEPNLTLSQQAHLQTIQSSGTHLLNIIHQVLDFARAEMGELPLEERDFDLVAMLRELRALFSLQAEAKALALRLEWENNLPRYWYGDAVKLRQIAINLLSNALKFTETGEVVVSVTVQPGANEAQQLTLAIADTGPGIAPEELPLLFTAFSQTESGRRQAQGTGLGLALSRYYAQRLGGDLTATSELGRGTTFRCTVLLRPGQAEGLPSVESVPQLAPGQPRYRLLVVDDHEVNRRLLIAWLQPLGFDVQGVADGPGAIATWQAWQPHLIFLDLRLPGLDGWAVARQIREQEATHPGEFRVVIIALSASVSEADRRAALAAGCDDFCDKPIQAAAILTSLQEHLGVQYVEPDATTGRMERPRLSRLHLQQLPGEQRQALVAALVRCDPRQIATAIAAIASTNPDLASSLEELAQNLRYDQLLDFLQAP